MQIEINEKFFYLSANIFEPKRNLNDCLTLCDKRFKQLKKPHNSFEGAHG